MIEKLALECSRYMVTKGAVQPDDMEVAAFSLESLFADVMQILVLLAVSLLFGIVAPLFLYCLFYTMLRRCAGGAHAGTHWGCICSFTASALIVVHGGLHFPVELVPAFLAVLSLFSMIAVFVRAPVTGPDNPRGEKSMAKFQKRSRVTVITEGAVLLLGALLSPAHFLYYFLCAGLGAAVASATLLIPRRQYKDKWKEG